MADEGGRTRVNPAEPNGGACRPGTAAGGLGVDDAAVAGDEGTDRGAGSGQPLAVRGGRHLTDESGGLAGQSEDLSKDVCDALGAVEALQHAEGADDLDLLGQQSFGGGCGLGGSLRINSGCQVVGELGECPALALEAPAPGGQQVVDGNPVHPRAQLALASEPVQPGDDLDQDLLRGVLGVHGIPEHAHRQAVHVVLDRSHELVEGLGVPSAGLLDQLGQGILSRRGAGVHSGHSTSITALSAVSSWATVSTNRSNISSGIPGAWTWVNTNSLPPSRGTSRERATDSTPPGMTMWKSITPSCSSVTGRSDTLPPSPVVTNQASPSAFTSLAKPIPQRGRFAGSATKSNTALAGASIEMVCVLARMAPPRILSPPGFGRLSRPGCDR